MQKKRRKRVNLNKIGFFLILCSILFFSYKLITIKLAKKEETKLIESYFNYYDGSPNYNKNDSKSENNIQYLAVLEIPKIKLKKGLVFATKDFKSINYEVSIDINSNFPDESGNFILYAHAGNSKISYFKDINKLDINDEAIIYYEGKEYIYEVVQKYEITKTGTLNLDKSYSDNNLILLTCVHKTNRQLVIICTLKNIK